MSNECPPTHLTIHHPFCVLCFMIFFFSLFLKGVCESGMGGLGDMKLIFGTTVVRKRGKAGKEDKVLRNGLYYQSFFFCQLSCAFFSVKHIYLF